LPLERLEPLFPLEDPLPLELFVLVELPDESGRLRDVELLPCDPLESELLLPRVPYVPDEELFDEVLVPVPVSLPVPPCSLLQPTAKRAAHAKIINDFFISSVLVKPLLNALTFLSPSRLQMGSNPPRTGAPGLLECAAKISSDDPARSAMNTPHDSGAENLVRSNRFLLLSRRVTCLTTVQQPSS